MNELGKVIQSTRRQLNSLNRELSTAIYESIDGDTPEAVIRLAMEKTDFPRRQRDIIAMGCINGAKLPLIGTQLELRDDLAKHWFLYRDFGGGVTLSKTLHTGKMRREIQQSLNSYFEVRRDVYEWKKVLGKVDSFDRIPAGLRDAVDEMRATGALSKKTYNRALASVKRLSSRGDITALKREYGRALELLTKGLDPSKAIERMVRAKTDYVQQRIMRTEFASAYEMSVARTYEEDDDVIGYRSLLSPDHPVPDICDCYAECDAYGMGPGGFPKSAGAVLPHHPHCICLKEPIYRGEVERVGRFSKVRVEEWGKSLPPTKKAQVFGRGHAERGEFMQSLRKQGYEPDREKQQMLPKRLLKEV